MGQWSGGRIIDRHTRLDRSLASYSAWFVPGYCTDDLGKLIMEWFQFFQAVAFRNNRVYWYLYDFTNLDCEHALAGTVGNRAGDICYPSISSEYSLRPGPSMD